MPENEQDNLRARIEAIAGVDDERPEVRELIKLFDQRFFKIRLLGGHPRVAEMKTEFLNGYHYQYLSTCSYDDFKKSYIDELVLVGVDDEGHAIFKNAGAVWLEKSRRVYDSATYAPNETLPDNIKNLWQGFAFEPKKGDCSLYLTHVLENICSGIPGYYEVVIGWMADAVQHPERHANWALAIRGDKGVGKNVFAEAFIKLWGPHGVIFAGEHAATSNFNAQLIGKSALLADEAIFALDRRQDRIIKGLITGEWLRIEMKGVDSFQVPNKLHTIIIGNDSKIVRATSDERRYFALECSNAHRQDQPYFEAINKELRNGGYEALLHYLLYEAKATELRDAPQTTELHGQWSGEPVEEMWLECLVTGDLPGARIEGDYGIVKIADIVTWANMRRRRGWDSITHDDVTKLLGMKGLKVGSSTTARIEKVKTRAWRIEPLATCRKNWNEKKFTREWPDDGDTWERIELF